MAIGYRFRGVPKVFPNKAAAIIFLKNSPGYVQRQSAYLQEFWPGLSAEIGLGNASAQFNAATRAAQIPRQGVPADVNKGVLHAANTILPAVVGLPADYTVSNITQHPIRTYQRQAAKTKATEAAMKAATLSGDQAKLNALTRQSTQMEVPFVGPVKAGKAIAEGLAAKEAAAVTPKLEQAAVDAAQGAKAAAMAERSGKPLSTGLPPLSPEEKLRQAMPQAKRGYVRQEKLRSEDRRLRAAKQAEAYRTIADPDAARAAAGAAMRGEYARIDYNGMTTLGPAELKHLKTVVAQHPSLERLPWEKSTIIDALDKGYAGSQLTPSEIRKIERIFGSNTAAGIAQHTNSLWDIGINVVNIPRSLQSTADFSAALRQGFVGMTTHPVLWAKSWPTMIKSMGSQKFFDAMNESIKLNPHYGEALAGDVSFTDIGEGVSALAHEEPFASDYATRIPGVGRIVKGSARGYIAFLNKLRMDIFAKTVEDAARMGTNVHDEHWLKSLGSIVNAATGRGNIHGKAEHLLPAMNTLMYSPRLMLSRLQYLDPTWAARAPKGLRMEVLKGQLGTAGYVAGMITLFSQIPGVKVGSMDPRSSDFGKLRVGNTRIDMAGGFQQYIRLASELATNTSVSSITGKKTKLGSGYGIPTRLDVVTSFAFNKAAPSVAIPINALRGHDPVGASLGKYDWRLGYNALTPLVLQDSIDLAKEKHGGLNGVAAAFLGYGLSSTGVGVQTYGPKKPKGAPAAPSTSTPDFSGGGSSGGSTPDFSGGGSSGGSRPGF